MTLTRVGSRAKYPFQYGRDMTISYPVTANGIRTRVVEAGSGDAVLFCLHGIGSRADRFVPAIPLLVSNGWHVFAIDLPGHGHADKGPGFGYRSRDFAAFTIAVLDELKLSGVTLAGTSVGAQVAVTVAVDRPDLVSRLVLIGAVGLSELPESVMMPADVVSDGSPEAVDRKLSLLVSDPAMVTEAWVREESMINSSDGARKALHEAAIALNFEANDDRQDSRLAPLIGPQLPVLLVWGEKDRWTPLAMGHEAHEHLPGSEFVTMVGCGHAPYFEDPGEFVRIVTNFARSAAQTVSNEDGQ